MGGSEWKYVGRYSFWLGKINKSEAARSFVIHGREYI